MGRKLLNTIKDYFETIDKPLDIVILTTKGYASKIKKLDTTLVNVLMPNYSVDEDKYIYAYSELFQIEDSSSAKDIFYIYSKYDIDTRDFLSYLFNEGKFEA